MFVLLDQFAWDQFLTNTDNDFKVLHVFLSDRLILGHLWAMYDPPLTYIFLCFQARFGIFQGGSHWASFHSSPILSMLTKRMARQRLTALTAPPLVLMTESSDRTQEQCFFSFSKYCLSCGQILYIHIDVGTSSDSKNIHGIVGWFHASDTQKHSATQVFGGRTGSQWKLWLSYQAWLETNIYMFNRCHRCAVYILYLSTSLSLSIYIYTYIRITVCWLYWCT